MKKYIITTERGTKIQILADEHRFDEKGVIIFSAKLITGGMSTVGFTPITSTVEVNDI